MAEHKLTFDENEIEGAANEFLHLTKGLKHFALYGSMGVGKTTFISNLCKLIGTNDLVSSPTFSIVNEYSTLDGQLIYHFDFYRVQNAIELLDIGFYEYCTPNAFCFIEWPEKGEAVLPDYFLRVDMEENIEGKRLVTFAGIT